MVRMIPPYPRAGANKSEQLVFNALNGLTNHDDWIALHSVSVGRHVDAFAGEADFIVLAPGRGIMVIEAKSPNYVQYQHGDWFLDKTPQPHKDPLKQLDGVRRSLRGFLKQLDLLQGDEPIVRLLWFTSLGRHQLENKSPGDLQFFEWELAWKDDIAKPAWVIEHAFDEYQAWFSQINTVENKPENFTVARAELVASAVIGEFTAKPTTEELVAERRQQEQEHLTENRLVLDLVGTNEHLSFDGPAGTGKSYLITETAKRFNREGLKTLVTCWNLLMAEELHAQVGYLPNVEAVDLNSLMLSLCGLPANPEGATDDWYTRELPEKAIAVLTEKPYLGGFETICVDEFQDIAGIPLLFDLLCALSASGSIDHIRFVLAGDSRQQIMRRADQRINAYQEALKRVPGLVHVRVRQNCRSAPALTEGVERRLGRKIGFTSHRVAQSVAGELTQIDGGADELSQTSALTKALRVLSQEYAPSDIVVLSPFGEKRSLAGKFLARGEKSKDERWLSKQLQRADGPGKIRWRSVFKFKGLDADAVVLTDIGDGAQIFISEVGHDWKDFMYVALTRAKYRCIVVTEPAIGHAEDTHAGG